MLSLLGFKSRFLAILMIFTYNLAFKENKRLIIEKKTELWKKEERVGEGLTAAMKGAKRTDLRGEDE